jgi:hypothetical protein
MLVLLTENLNVFYEIWYDLHLSYIKFVLHEVKDLTRKAANFVIAGPSGYMG